MTTVDEGNLIRKAAADHMPVAFDFALGSSPVDAPTAPTLHLSSLYALTSVTWRIDDGDGALTFDEVSSAGAVAYARLLGGTRGKRYAVKVLAETNESTLPRYVGKFKVLIQ